MKVPLLLALVVAVGAAGGCSERRGTRSDEVFVVGNSLTVDAFSLAGELEERGVGVTFVDAELGRTTEQGLRVLERVQDELPEAVMVALGTNDVFTATEADVDRWVARARSIVGDRRLVWVNLYLQPQKNPERPGLARFTDINDWLADAADRHDVEIADWASYAEEHGIETVDDGVHYDDEASKARAEFSADVMAGRIPTE